MNEIDISVSELLIALAGPPPLSEKSRRLCVEIASRKPEWQIFKNVFNSRAKIEEYLDPGDDIEGLVKKFPVKDIQDLIVPHDLARTILAESGRYGYVTPNGFVTNGPNEEAISKISYLDLYLRFGGGFLEGMYEKGANNMDNPSWYKSERQLNKRRGQERRGQV